MSRLNIGEIADRTVKPAIVNMRPQAYLRDDQKPRMQRGQVGRQPNTANLIKQEENTPDSLLKQFGEMATNDENIYYNMKIYNPNQYDLIPTEFSETRLEPIIQNPSEYFLSVIRFQLNGQGIPLMIFPVKVGANNVNEGSIVLTMSYINTFVQLPVSFIPRILDTRFPPPATPVSKEGSKAVYYWMFQISQMIEMWNATLAQCFAGLGAPVGATAPYFIYDSQTQLISLIAQTQFYDKALPNPIKIYANRELFITYMQGLPHLSVDLGVDIQFQLLVYNQANNFYNPENVAPAIPPAYYQMQQEFVAFDSWYSPKTIVFTTTQIPVISEGIPPVGTEGTTVSSNDNTQSILTDFEIFFDTAGQQRIIQYLPSAQYRLINLQSTTPLKSFDIKVFWTDAEGQQYPIFVQPYGTTTVKFLFVKKSLYINK